MARNETTDFELARDDLFSNINRCGVLQATGDQQVEWLDDTMHYLAERYPGLSQEQLGELRLIGERFCRPVIQHGKGNTALTTGGHDGEEPAEAVEAVETVEAEQPAEEQAATA